MQSKSPAWMKRRLVSLSLMPTPIAPMMPALQLIECLEARIHHRLEALVQDLAVLGRPEIDVVHQGDVDPGEPEPEMRVLERAHDAVIGVVEYWREARQGGVAEVGRRLLAGRHGVQDAAGVCR